MAVLLHASQARSLVVGLFSFVVSRDASFSSSLPHHSSDTATLGPGGGMGAGGGGVVVPGGKSVQGERHRRFARTTVTSSYLFCPPGGQRVDAWWLTVLAMYNSWQLGQYS